MKIEHLYYYLEIVRSKSMNKAADRLFVSQQHLSRIVNGMEKDFDVVLFKRNSKGIHLTPQGEVFYRYADKIVNLYADMKKEFALDALPSVDLSERIEGECAVSIPFFFSLYLNDFIEKMNQKYPDIVLECYEDSEELKLENFERSNHIHLISDSNARRKSVFADNNNLRKYYIGQTELLFCVNKNSPLAEKSVLTENDLRNYKVTNYKHVHNYAERYDEVLHFNSVLFISSNIYQHLDSVLNNNSLCFVPTYLKKGIAKKYPDIACIPYEFTYPVPMYIVVGQQLELTPAVKAIIEFMADYMQTVNS